MNSESQWIDVELELPNEGEVVACQCGPRVFLGGYCWVPDGEYWAWGVLTGVVYWNGTYWDGDVEVDDDYAVTKWCGLPKPCLGLG